MGFIFFFLENWCLIRNWFSWVISSRTWGQLRGELVLGMSSWNQGDICVQFPVLSLDIRRTSGHGELQAGDGVVWRFDKYLLTYFLQLNLFYFLPVFDNWKCVLNLSSRSKSSPFLFNFNKSGSWECDVGSSIYEEWNVCLWSSTWEAADLKQTLEFWIFRKSVHFIFRGRGWSHKGSYSFSFIFRFSCSPESNGLLWDGAGKEFEAH